MSGRPLTVAALAVAAGGAVVAVGFAFGWFSPAPAAPPPITASVPRAPAHAPTAPPTPAVAPASPASSSSKRVAERPAPEPVTKVEAPPPAPTDATLHVDSDVPGAMVFLDRKYLGTTPITLDRVTPGAHRLNVSAEGYEGYVTDLDVAPGLRDIVVKFKEIVLDARTPVVHSHRIGSCKGVLVATPQGLRYDTDNKDDQFSAALSDLETFDMDYAAKKLKVKIRGGRSYEFTDPDGNLNRLMTFENTVAHVLAKLKQQGGGK